LSEIRATTISDTAGTGPITLTGQSAAKAWVNFNGDGIIAARDSLNVASLFDTSNGDYEVNFTSSLANSDYCSTSTAGSTSGVGRRSNNATVTDAATGSIGVVTVISSTVGYTNPESVNLQVSGDLA
jgi:hypothetical protein